MKEMQVALYARVSSEQQAEAGTIASQLAALRERIAQDGQTLLPELTFIDEGYSGATLIRPALERLRDRIALQGLDRLYVLCPDRLARKYAYQVLLVDEFQRAGVAVIFLNRAMGQSPEDDLLLQMQGMIAEYERAKILERSRRGKRHAAQVGVVAVLSGAPYGYRYVSKPEGNGQARYEIVPEQAQVVQQIFRWVGIERASISAVCRRLQQAKIRTPRGKNTWGRSTVGGILNNPAYKGQAAFGKTHEEALRPRLRALRGRPLQPRRARATIDQPVTGWTFIPVPAIVTEDLFESVQQQLQENRQRARQSQHGARYLLQGLLVCAHCGYAYYGKPVSQKSAKGKKRNYAYYRCIGSDAYRFGGERVCNNRQVRADLLEQIVWQEVCDLLRDQQRLQQEYTRRLSSPRKDNATQSIIQAQIDKVRQGITRLIDGYTEGFLQKQEFEPRATRLRERLKELEQQAQRMADDESLRAELQTAIHRLAEFGASVQESLATADWQVRRELICVLVKRVEVAEEEVRIVFRVPPDLNDLSPGNGSLQHCTRRPRTLSGRMEREEGQSPSSHCAPRAPASGRKKRHAP